MSNMIENRAKELFNTTKSYSNIKDKINISKYLNKQNENIKKNSNFFTRKLTITISFGILLLICAITIPVLLLNNGGENMAGTYKTELLSAVNKLKLTDSYVETIDVKMEIDGISTDINYTTKYQKVGKEYIAEGFTKTGEVIQTFYVYNGFMYLTNMNRIENPDGLPIPGALLIPGVKIRLPEGELISFIEFFAKNYGYLRPEVINQLNKESNIKKEKESNGMSVYSFSLKDTQGNPNLLSSNYIVTIDSTSGRILEINQNNIVDINGSQTNATLKAVYNYADVKVIFPDDLEEYVEYTG